MLSLSYAGPDAEWLERIPAVSANARFTLTSMFPSLFLKSCGTLDHRMIW